MAFGPAWALSQFPENHDTATLWGQVRSVIRTSPGRIQFKTFFALDGQVVLVDDRDVVDFTLLQPGSWPQDSTTTSSRTSTRGRKIKPRQVDSDSSDSDEPIMVTNINPAKPATIKRRRAPSKSTQALNPDESEIQDQDNASVHSTSDEEADSLRCEQAKSFDYFPDLNAFASSTTDAFCDANSTPCARFQPFLRHQSPGFLQPERLFETMLPMSFLKSSVLAGTNVALSSAGARVLDEKEFFLYLGLRAAMARYPTNKVRDFFGKKHGVLDPCFDYGKFGMPINRFEEITSHLKINTFSEGSDQLQPLRDIFSAITAHMHEVFQPGWLICVDESMIVWTNKWTAPGAWMYVNRKPHPMGFEVRDLACGTSRIVFSLELQEGAGAKRLYDKHGKMAGCVLRLCEQAKLFKSRPRVIVGDSAFPSIRLLQLLYAQGIHGVFAIKPRGSHWPIGMPGATLLKATRELPLGQSVCLQSTPSKPPRFFMAGLRDMTPCLLIANASSMSVRSEAPVTTRFLTTVTGRSEKKEFKRPEVFELFYETRHVVDDFNHLRQGCNGIEEAWKTKSWEHRALAFILALADANAFNAYKMYQASNDLPELDHDKFRAKYVLHLLGKPRQARQSEVPPLPCESRTFQRNERMVAGRFVSRQTPTRTYKQLNCATHPTNFNSRRRTTRYCTCDPTVGMCQQCFALHVKK